MPGRVTDIGLSRSGFLKPLSEGLVWPEGLVCVGLVWPDGLVAVGLVWPEGLVDTEEPAWPEGRPEAGRVTVVLGLRSFEGFAAGRADEGLRSAVPDCLTVPAERFVEPDCLTVPVERLEAPDCLVTVAEDFELVGLVPVTLVVLEAVREVPVLERDSPLRACAYASDSNATNVNAVNIAASVAVIVLIIVQF